MSEPKSSPHFEELLPWYVNGTLAEAQRAELEDQIDRDPRLKAQSRWLRGLQSELRSSGPSHASEYGLAVLLARIRAEREGRVVSLPTSRPWAAVKRPLVAIAAGTVMVQAAVIAFLLAQPTPAQRMEPLSVQSARGVGVLLQVTFRASATELAIRKALTNANAEIVGGPGGLGVYQVMVPGPSAEQTLKMLSGDPAVESVTRPGG